MSERVKYPRTPHLPWSPGFTTDDKRLSGVSRFVGTSVVVTEKLDGENTTVYSDGYSHARSTDSGSAVWRDWMRARAAEVSLNIPTGWRVVGENVWAEHSIRYSELESYWYVFAVVNDEDVLLPWEDVKAWCVEAGQLYVPELYSGEWNEGVVRDCFTGVSQLGGEQEGYVVRVADAFHFDTFGLNSAKYVRENHVTTGQHWTHGALKRNGLKLGA